MASSVLLSWACGSASGPHEERAAHLSVIPNFHNLAAVIDVRSIEVSLSRLDGTMAASDTVSVAPGEKDIELALVVSLAQPTEDFDLRITMTDGAGAVLYRNQPDPQRITVSRSTSAVPVEVAIAYVGPGNEAESIAVMPVDATIVANETIEFVAVARDVAGNSVTGMPVEWIVLDPLATLQQSDSVTPAVAVVMAGTTPGVTRVAVRDARGNADTATVTISLNTVSFTTGAQQVAENAGLVTLSVRLSAVSTVPVTVPFTVTGSATSPDDYTISASPLTILAGELMEAITITLVDDALTEPDETVIVSLGTPTNTTPGAITVQTVTILDDEGIPLSDQETIFNFDFSNAAVPPPYDAIRFGATFSVSDPVLDPDVLITNVYGAADGADLIQARNDTQFITDGGTVYGPLTTANPIFDPMLDGIFSFGLVMNSGTAILRVFEVCGVIQSPFQETCRTIP